MELTRKQIRQRAKAAQARIDAAETRVRETEWEMATAATEKVYPLPHPTTDVGAASDTMREGVRMEMIEKKAAEAEDRAANAEQRAAIALGYTSWAEWLKAQEGEEMAAA